MEVSDAGGMSKSSSRSQGFVLCDYAQHETVACIGAVRDRGHPLAPGIVQCGGISQRYFSMLRL
jgi:hypothetical protein